MRTPDLAKLVLHHKVVRTAAADREAAPSSGGKGMKRTWLTALIPIALAFTALLVSAAAEHACVGQPLLASDAGDRSNGDFVGEATVSACDAFGSSQQISQIAFERATDFGAVPTFSFAPAPSIFTLLGLGLASLAFLHRQVTDVKPLIGRKPP